MQWLPHVDKLVMEMLAYRTPPSCIQANLLAMARTLNAKSEVIKEIPCRKHIQNLRSVLAIQTKTLAAKIIGQSKCIQQFHTDETGRAHISIVNVIVSVLNENDELKTVCLAGDIFPPDKTAEEQSKEVVSTFAESGRLLDNWRRTTQEMYGQDEDCAALLAQIPKGSRLCVTRCLGATMSTDNCTTANLTQEKTAEKIYAIAQSKGITTPSDLVIHFGNCHNHIRNVWCKAITKRLCKRLTTDLKQDIDAFPPHLRICCDLMNIHRYVQMCMPIIFYQYLF